MKSEKDQTIIADKKEQLKLEEEQKGEEQKEIEGIIIHEECNLNQTFNYIDSLISKLGPNQFPNIKLDQIPLNESITDI